jgi:hypothetical protein
MSESVDRSELDTKWYVCNILVVHPLKSAHSGTIHIPSFHCVPAP